MIPHNALPGTIALGGRRQRNWCVHNLFICALSHTFGSHIHNLWHRSVDHLLNSALLKTLMENDMHHSDYLFHERMNRNVPVDGTIATITGSLNLAVREIKHPPRQRRGRWTLGRNHQRTTISQCPIYGAVRCCTSLELLHQRGHYLYDALHRTNYLDQCQSGTAYRVRLPSMQDFQEMVLDVHELIEICQAISKKNTLSSFSLAQKEE